jgi:hypothetical protein
MNNLLIIIYSYLLATNGKETPRAAGYTCNVIAQDS